MADKQKVAALCSECRENEVMKKRKRKFRVCYDCRVKMVKAALAGRARYSELKNSVNKLVEYYDGGFRYGYLVLLRRGGAAIQPLGTLTGPLPREVTMRLKDVKAVENGKAKSLQEFLATRRPKVLVSKPVSVDIECRDEKGKPVIVFSGLDLAEKVEVVVPVQVPAKFTEREQPKKVNAPKVPKTPKTGFIFDKAKAVEMFQQGTKISVIAEALHGPYALGHTGNLVRAALREAGVYRKVNEPESPTTNPA